LRVYASFEGSRIKSIARSEFAFTEWFIRQRAGQLHCDAKGVEEIGKRLAKRSRIEAVPVRIDSRQVVARHAPAVAVPLFF